MTQPELRRRLDRLFEAGDLPAARHATLCDMLQEAAEKHDGALLDDIRILIEGVPTLAQKRLVMRIAAMGGERWWSRPAQARQRRIMHAPDVLSLHACVDGSEIVRYFERLNQVARIAFFLTICSLGFAFGFASHAATAAASLLLCCTAALIGWSRLDQRQSQKILDALNQQWQ